MCEVADLPRQRTGLLGCCNIALNLPFGPWQEDKKVSKEELHFVYENPRCLLQVSVLLDRTEHTLVFFDMLNLCQFHRLEATLTQGIDAQVTSGGVDFDIEGSSRSLEILLPALDSLY
jgi:hypothetical protein